MEFSFTPVDRSGEGQPAATGPLDSPRLSKLLASSKGWSLAFGAVNAGFAICFSISLVKNILAWREAAPESASHLRGFLIGQVVGNVIYILAFGLPAVCLFLYSRQVARFRNTGDNRQLPAIFACQRTVWIVYSVMLGLFALLTLCAMFWLLSMARSQAIVFQ